MAALGPISRTKLIRALRTAGFAGPYSGSDHDFMKKADLTVRIPNPHGSDIRPNLLAEISKAGWNFAEGLGTASIIGEMNCVLIRPIPRKFLAHPATKRVN